MLVKTFILILWITTYRGSGLTTAEFTGEEACRDAGSLAIRSMPLHGKRGFICVPKD